MIREDNLIIFLAGFVTAELLLYWRLRRWSGRGGQQRPSTPPDDPDDWMENYMSDSTSRHLYETNFGPLHEDDDDA